MRLPLRLAWALTVHKSQGMSLPRLQVRCMERFGHDPLQALPADADECRFTMRGFEVRREGEHWVPARAYEVVGDFRRRHTPETPLETYGDLLLKLNLVWRAREKLDHTVHSNCLGKPPSYQQQK